VCVCVCVIGLNRMDSLEDVLAISSPLALVDDDADVNISSNSNNENENSSSSSSGSSSGGVDVFPEQYQQLLNDVRADPVLNDLITNQGLEEVCVYVQYICVYVLYVL